MTAYDLNFVVHLVLKVGVTFLAATPWLFAKARPRQGSYLADANGNHNCVYKCMLHSPDGSWPKHIMARDFWNLTVGYLWSFVQKNSFNVGP